MANKYGVPREVELRIRERDAHYIYCGTTFSQGAKGNSATIEHLNELPPFYWKDGLIESGVAI